MPSFNSSFEFFLVYLILTIVLIVLTLIFYKYKSKKIEISKLKFIIFGLIIISITFYIINSLSNFNHGLESLKNSTTVIYSNIFFIILCFSTYLFFYSLLNFKSGFVNNEIKEIYNNKVKDKQDGVFDIEYDNEEWVNYRMNQENKTFKEEKKEKKDKKNLSDENNLIFKDNDFTDLKFFKDEVNVNNDYVIDVEENGFKDLEVFIDELYADEKKSNKYLKIERK